MYTEGEGNSYFHYFYCLFYKYFTGEFLTGFDSERQECVLLTGSPGLQIKGDKASHIYVGSGLCLVNYETCMAGCNSCLGVPCSCGVSRYSILNIHPPPADANQGRLAIYWIGKGHTNSANFFTCITKEFLLARQHKWDARWNQRPVYKNGRQSKKGNKTKCFDKN